MGRRVAVVGAGAAGLVAARWLIEAGIEPALFERHPGLGGLWRPDTGLAYPTLRTNTSKQKTAFSDQPFDAALPDFPGRDDVLAYLEGFADRFDLRRRIRFGTAVRSVRRGDGGWDVDGEAFDAVVVCSGLFARPVLPALPGRERFGGAVIHSRDYGSPEAFAGRDVVVIGAGSSAIDIARDLVGVARSVHLSMRDVPTFTPRLFRGRPYDHRATRLWARLPGALRARRVRRALAEEYARRGARLDRVVAKRTAGTEVLEAIARGRIVAHGQLAALDADGVAFADGARARADVIVCATGYAVEFPFLSPDVPGTVEGALALYRLVWPPEVGGLAFVAMCRVHGPVFPIAELQARWVAAVFAGRASLPGPGEMRAEIASRVARARASGGDPMRVDLLEYLDDIAARIGARPSLVRRPHLLFSPVNAGDYRCR